jgi:hypothetical protein
VAYRQCPILGPHHPQHLHPVVPDLKPVGQVWGTVLPFQRVAISWGGRLLGA